MAIEVRAVAVARAMGVAVLMLSVSCGGSSEAPADSPEPEASEPPADSPEPEAQPTDPDTPDPPTMPPELAESLDTLRQSESGGRGSPTFTPRGTPPAPSPAPARPLPMPSRADLMKWGDFKGTVRTEWLEDNRSMKLLEDFQYIDPGGMVWEAPAGIEIDGASIPRVFWTFIGGPFEGRYRNASVVHDWACDLKNRMNTWQRVHQMFYLASLRGGVSELSAKIMYGAVYHYGPRWNNPPPRTLRDDADFLRMREYISRNSTISLDAIEQLTSDFLREQIPEVPPPMLVPLF